MGSWALWDKSLVSLVGISQLQLEYVKVDQLAVANKDTAGLAGDERSGPSPSALQVGCCAVCSTSMPTYVAGR